MGSTKDWFEKQQEEYSNDLSYWKGMVKILNQEIDLLNKKIEELEGINRANVRKFEVGLSSVKIDKDNLDYIKNTEEICGKLRGSLIDLFKEVTNSKEDVEYKLPEFNDEVRWILGRPNFLLMQQADILRKSGIDIHRKAEDEQANVLYWYLTLYVKYGKEWHKEAIKLLKEYSEKYFKETSNEN